MANNKQRGPEVSGWVGWQYFAAYVMMLAGVFQTIAGFVALFKDDVFVVTQSHLLLFDFTQWGIVHILIGIVLFFSSFSLLAGRFWGRMIGIFMASLSAIANFAFFDAYPLWSLTVILLDILIIYAIAVHGSEVKDV
jgi:hypothetical protein